MLPAWVPDGDGAAASAVWMGKPTVKLKNAIRASMSPFDTLDTILVRRPGKGTLTGLSSLLIFSTYRDAFQRQKSRREW